MSLHRSDVPPIYAITDSAHGAHSDLARMLFAAGVRWLQVREKRMADLLVYREVERIVAEAPAGCTVFVNDRADIAVAAGAAGVHGGEEDLPPRLARQMAGSRPLLIGYSTHSVDEAAEAAADPAVDYVALGPIFASPTKNVRPPLGVEALGRARNRIEKPIVAIGGIHRGNIAAVLAAGADSAAVISALYATPSIAANVRALLDAAGRGA